MGRKLTLLAKDVSTCRRCPRLVAWREHVAEEKKREFRDWTYWGRGVPGFGDPQAKLVVLGLAPAAHGSNRTGRPFTGDRSGDWLYAAFHRCGLARLGVSVSADDGQELYGIFLTAGVKCAPPANKPLPEERDKCAEYLDRELQALPAKTVLALGGFAWAAGLNALKRLGHVPAGNRPRFGHEAVARVGEYTLVGCYHPSPLNTSTGKLTAEMLDSAIEVAKAQAGLS